LLVVNPTEDLLGAEQEGNRIIELFKDNPLINIHQLRGSKATWTALRAEMRSGRYDVMHYAGHAYFNKVHPSDSGILCHGGKVLSGADLAGLGSLPALVFFNACETARVRSPNLRQKGQSTRERIERNAGLAEAFLRGGVANYVGTYWPVGDAAAKLFAGSFYEELINGATLGHALATGRQEVQNIQSVDWADYIHYGSPGYRVKLSDNNS
jgi:CHAT domain-containing protein